MASQFLEVISMSMYTIPHEEDLERYAVRMLPGMFPNTQPLAVVNEGFLTDEQCDAILAEVEKIEPYNFPTCGASMTRQIDSLVPSLTMASNLGHYINEIYWQYNLVDGLISWMQTYNKGDNYELHTDTSPGQSRKLTGVIMLTDHEDYNGGVLELHPPPHQYNISRKRGTIVFFQPWIPHLVTEVTYGTRKTINMGYFGPPFK